MLARCRRCTVFCGRGVFCGLVFVDLLLVVELRARVLDAVLVGEVAYPRGLLDLEHDAVRHLGALSDAQVAWNGERQAREQRAQVCLILQLAWVEHHIVPAASKVHATVAQPVAYTQEAARTRSENNCGRRERESLRGVRAEH